MEAAAIAWRPLGRLLVEQGLLTDRELELALAKQQLTGKRLGETIVECGFVSRPDLSNALAAQYGIELTTETGFGTGLRAQIQQRHENDRGRVVPIGVAQPVEAAAEMDAEPEDTESPRPAEVLLLAQLEEQWARLAAAEEQLAERQLALTLLAAERDRRLAQAERLARRARGARTEHSVQRDRKRAQVVRLIQRVRSRDAELERRNEELRCLGGVVDVEVEEQRTLLAAAEQRLAERERELAALAAEKDRRRTQVVRFIQRVRSRDAELARRGEQLHELAQAVGGQADEQRARLAAADHRLAERERELAELTTDRDRRRAQVVRFARRVRTRGEAADGLRDQAERLAGDIRGCDAEIERLRSENAHRRAQGARLVHQLRELRRGRDEDPVVTVSSHLVFVQLADGYELVERDGPPPPRHSPLELPDLCDSALVVAGSRPSPFPGDARPCVVVQPA